MWHAMENAQHIIYITNWHFNPETKNPFDESLPTIGELLKKKSKQGELSVVLDFRLHTSNTRAHAQTVTSCVKRLWKKPYLGRRCVPACARMTDVG